MYVTYRCGTNRMLHTGLFALHVRLTCVRLIQDQTSWGQLNHSVCVELRFVSLPDMRYTSVMNEHYLCGCACMSRCMSHNRDNVVGRAVRSFSQNIGCSLMVSKLFAPRAAACFINYHVHLHFAAALAACCVSTTAQSSAITDRQCASETQQTQHACSAGHGTQIGHRCRTD